MNLFVFFVVFLSTTRFELATVMLNNFTALLDVVLQALPQTFSRFFLGSSHFLAFCFLWVGGVPLAAFCPPGFLRFRVVGLGFSATSCTLASISVG